MRVTLTFGSMAEPVADQLARCGIHPPPGQSGEWDRWIAAVAKLSAAGMVTTPERDRVERRIFKSITRAIRDHQESAAMLANHRERT